MTEPNDRPLEDYLKGGSKLSQKYREASGETAPPELDEKILAQARAEVSPRRRRSSSPWYAGLALAATVVLAVNLGWNVYRAKPELGEAARTNEAQADKGFVPNPPAPTAVAEAKPQAVAPVAKDMARAADAVTRQENVLRDQDTAEDDLRKKEVEHRASVAQAQEMEARRDEPERKQAEEAGALASAPPAMAAGAAAPASAPAMQAKLKADTPTESQKIDRLIAYIGGLQGAKFVRNDTEYGPDEAVKHLQLKREKAGDRVKTADDFIKYCASYSSVSGEAYLIKFSDGHTRTAEDVLREELGRINAGG